MTENRTGEVPGTAGPQEVARHAQQAAGDVVSTGRDQARVVASETADQVKNAVQDMRTRVADQAEQQARRVAQQLSRIADELSGMADDRSDSMTAPAIRQVADTSRQAAGFLENRGAQGMLDSVQDYARRKPGTFLLGAAVAGFLVGRVAKTASGGAQRDGTGPQHHVPDVTAPAPRSGEQAMAPVASTVGAGRAGTGYPDSTTRPGETAGTGYSSPTARPGEPAGMGYPGQSGVNDPTTRHTGPSGMGYPSQSGVDAGETGGGPHVDR